MIVRKQSRNGTLLSATLLLSLFTAIAGCGGGKSAFTTQAPPLEASLAPEDASLQEPDGLFLEGVSTAGLNPRAATVRLRLVGAQFSTDQVGGFLRVNGADTPLPALTPNTTEVLLPVNLVEGKNTISFKGYDTVGRPLFKNETIWAGDRALQVRVLDSSGALVTQPVTVSLTLADDTTIGDTATALSGTAAFQNLPDRTVIVEARTADNQVGVGGGVGSDGTITVRLGSFGTSSGIDNNDFSQGLAGWEVGTTPTTIIPHIEGFPETRSISEPLRLRARQGIPVPRIDTVPVPGITRSRQAGPGNNDLQLETDREGPVSIRRTFATPVGTSSVRVRYRFITSEVPGGFFGTKFNDFFGVVLRSQKKGTVKSENSAMNSLGLAAFDFDTGATDWRTVTLQTDPTGDTIQLDVTVANVGDGSLDSSVIVDFIEQDQQRVIPTIVWNNQQGGLRVGFKVEGTTPLEAPATISVFFASGTTFDSRIGGAVQTITIPAGTAPGVGTPVNVPGSALQNDPAGAAFLLASSSETQVASVPDVKITLGANADSGAVSAGLNDLLKDALRTAGQSTATVTSTARSPEDQARAMFNNLVKSPGPLTANIAEQKTVYAAPGDAVISVFATQAGTKTLEEVVADATAIKAAMLAEVNSQGPSSVSKHCANPAVVSVTDVAKSSFGSNGALFKAAATARASTVLDENNVFHVELNAP